MKHFFLRNLSFALLFCFLMGNCGGCASKKDSSSGSSSEPGSTPVSSGSIPETTDTDLPPLPPTLPAESVHWSFDGIEEDGALLSKDKEHTATAINCLQSPNGVKGYSLSFSPASGSAVDFGTSISHLLNKHGAISVSTWVYRSSPGQKVQLLTLCMENGKAGFQITIEDKLITVSCRSHPKDILHSKTYACDASYGCWNHLAVTADYKKGEIHLYWNNAEQSTTFGNTQINFPKKGYFPGSPLKVDLLGGDPTEHFKAEGLKGNLDEFTVFGGVASKEEIKDLFWYNADSESLSGKEKGYYGKLRTLTKLGSNVIALGSNAVLDHGKRLYLVPGSASLRTIEKSGTICVPLSFFHTYYEKKSLNLANHPTDGFEVNGITYVPLESTCNALSIPCQIFENTIAVMGEKAGSYTETLLDFLKSYFFEGAYPLPEAEDDHTVTRSEVIYSNYPQNGISLGSPSLAKLPDGSLLASFDWNGKSYTPIGKGTNDTGVCRSVDGGKTWVRIATVERMMWCTLFVNEGTAYLTGRDTLTGKLAIVKSTDSGKSWTSPDIGQIDRSVGSLHHAPTPAVIVDGKIYIAFEDSCSKEGIAKWTWTKRAYMMSASLNSDLLSEKSWTKSNSLSFDPKWMDPNLYYGDQMGFLEGNAVPCKDGSLAIILRVESDPTCGKACVLKLSRDGNSLSFEQIIDLPIGKDKFVIRFDSESQTYIAIGNVKTTNNCPTQRNVLSMYISKDLYHWEYATTLLTDNSLLSPLDSMRKHGLQYPDFIIDGEDIHLVIREASGSAEFYHNANYITYYQIQKFRTYLH